MTDDKMRQYNPVFVVILVGFHYLQLYLKIKI